MTLYKKIQAELKEAMLAKQAVRLLVIRGMLAAFTNELVATKRKPTDELSNEEILNVIRRQVKQRKDSIEQFAKGGRKDLVKSETEEMKILETYLPKMMGKDEIKKVAEAKKTELGISDKKEVGKLMSVIMKELKGKADGQDVKDVVNELME